MSSVSIADFGTGNLRSVCNAFAALDGKIKIKLTDSAVDIKRADRLVLPGQGAIGTFMSQVADEEHRQSLEFALSNKPVLGICLGLQSLYSYSEEDGGTECLGLLGGSVRRFDAALTDAGRRIKIPHMGWSRVNHEMEHPLWHGIENGTRFYFVHSYYADSANESEIAGSSHYGLKFTCAAARDNLFAVQFHPEKSRRHGLRLLRNFMQWDGTA